jgi:BMFP domain-containing protein YqiC
MSTFQTFVDQISGRIASLASAQPAHDLEKNIRALLSASLQRLDLVPREEFDTQRLLLQRALEQVRALETRITALEAGRAP